uniref:B-cell receptor CD22 n=1 Tax=Oryzias melastigma TaxID=30732 RepID=A0A3B3C8A5_ORYME
MCDILGLLLLHIERRIHSQTWGVEYSSTQICALEGSTVEIPCTYSYPSWKDYKKTVVQRTFWFTELNSRDPLDLREDPDYADRITYHFSGNNCLLRISDLKLMDSAEYKFRIETNQQGGSYSGSPGVTLTVTGPRVEVIRSSSGLGLVCSSRCFPPGHFSFMWFKNGEEIQGETSYSYRNPVSPEDTYSCSYEGQRSSEVYAPKSVIVSMNLTEILEDRSVTLTCSSDANPAASYTWFKDNQGLLPGGPYLILPSVHRSDSGRYHCVAENELGKTASEYVSINVEYPPKTSNVSVNPSAEILEDSSVTLTCSSDANPAASYTWFKDNRTLISEQEVHFSSIRSEDSGNYSCKSKNKHGQSSSVPLLLDVQCKCRL